MLEIAKGSAILKMLYPAISARQLDRLSRAQLKSGLTNRYIVYQHNNDKKYGFY